MNPHYSGIIASLTLHTAVFSLIFLIPQAKLPPLAVAMRITFVDSPVITDDHRETAPKPAAPAPKPRKASSRPEAAAPKPQPQIATRTTPQAADTVAVHVGEHTVGIITDEKPRGNVVKPETTGGGPAAVVETSFGTAGAPAFIHREMPVYPMMARRLGKEGRVVLKLHIDMKGTVRHIEIVEAAGYGFTEAAVEAIRKSTFAPAQRNGEKVTARAILPIRFHLE